MDESGNITSIVPVQTTQDTQMSAEKSTIGSDKIPAGKTQVEIANHFIGKQSKIFITPRSKTGGQNLIVTDVKENTSFTIEIEHPISSEIPFDWFIVNK